MKEFIKALASVELVSELVASMVVGALLAVLGRSVPSIRRWVGIETPTEPEPYSQRLAKLTTKLTQASSEVDSLLAELAQVASDRESAVQELDRHLASLEQREAQLQKQIEELQSIPVPAAEHFATMVQSGEKRSAWRDYMLFGAGVVVSIVVSVLIR